MDTVDWRTQLQPDFRQRKVNQIISKLSIYHLLGDEDTLLEVQKTAQSFEHKTYAGATSLDDYLQKISPMIPSIEERSGWRAQLHPDSRQRIVNKIMDTLRRHLPISGPEGFIELHKIAARFEKKIYTAATSQSDYLWKLSLKMLAMENKSQNTSANSVPSNPGGNSGGPSETGSGMQSQVQN